MNTSELDFYPEIKKMLLVFQIPQTNGFMRRDFQGMLFVHHIGPYFGGFSLSICLSCLFVCWLFALLLVGERRP